MLGGRRRRKRGWRLDGFYGALEHWYVRAGGEFDANFIGVCRVVIILGEALADFSRGDANDRVGIGIVSGRPGEDFHADGALFDLVGVAIEGLLDDESEESRITFALEKKRVNEEQFELGEDCLPVGQ